MEYSLSTPPAIRAVLAVAAAGLTLLGGGSATAQSLCHTVQGTYDEHPVSGCDSPVGLCIAGTYYGAIRGPFEGAATTLVETADTPTSTVRLFTSDSSISASVAGREGTLLIKNAGAFTGNPDGSIVDLQTIVGGTDELAGASGSLRASGTFMFPDGGSSHWTGVVCLP
jgi:hypothetical protein